MTRDQAALTAVAILAILILIVIIAYVRLSNDADRLQYELTEERIRDLPPRGNGRHRQETLPWLLTQHEIDGVKNTRLETALEYAAAAIPPTPVPATAHRHGAQPTTNSILPTVRWPYREAR